MDEPVLMKCGCVAMAKKTATRGQQHDPIPACIIHDCTEPAENVPSLEDRLAQCHCGHTKPSSYRLPFFEYRGKGSPHATLKCKCGYSYQAHRQNWRCHIRIVRRWYKHKRYEHVQTREAHLETEELAKIWAGGVADSFLSMQREETKVFSATVEKIEPIRSEGVCGEFAAVGPHEFDNFYCGHSGWD